jgi:uncharacterized protein (TIGR01777 family)
VIPGGSGFLGRGLARAFLARGDRVVVLSRHADSSSPWETVLWDGKTLGDWKEALDHSDVVLNLAGRSVNCRYTQENRRQIMDSRIASTRVLGQAIQKLKDPPRLWMNASTATIYRHSLDQDNDECGTIGGGEAGAPPTWAFSIDVATSWEKTFFSAHVPGTRKIALRTAMVMAPDPGGAFDQFCKLVRLGLGGNVGPGSQFVSWIHHLDFVRALGFLMEREGITGAVNVSAPNPLPYRDFMRAIRRACGAPFGLPTSGPILRLGAMLWRTETELLLKSRRVVPARLLNHGFEFLFPEWPVASLDLTNQRGLTHRFGRFAASARW